MWRQVVVLLLVPLLLLPGLCFAHSHAGTGVLEPPEHDATPHFHLRCLFAVLFPQLHPVHCSCHPAHGNERALHPDRPAEDHDADAVYLPGSALLGRLNEHGPVVALDSALVPTLATVPDRTDNLAVCDRPLGHPPFLPSEFCPIYLKTCTLLI